MQQFTTFLFESTKHDTAVITVFFIELFEVKRKGIHGINFLLVLGENRLYRLVPLRKIKKVHFILPK